MELVKNPELAWKVLDRIRTQVEFGEEVADGWDQEVWARQQIRQGEVCGTTRCFAGWTVTLSGGEIIFPPVQRSRRGTCTYAPAADTVATPEGTHRPIDAWATWLLGLDRYETKLLFYCPNDLEELEALVEEIFGPRP